MRKRERPMVILNGTTPGFMIILSCHLIAYDLVNYSHAGTIADY